MLQSQIKSYSNISNKIFTWLRNLRQFLSRFAFILSLKTLENNQMTWWWSLMKRKNHNQNLTKTMICRIKHSNLKAIYLSSQTTFSIDCKSMHNATIIKATKADWRLKRSQNLNFRSDQTKKKKILNSLEHKRIFATATEEGV